SYKKFDRWDYVGGEAESPVENKMGYNDKAGLLFHFEENHYNFGNDRLYSCHPLLDNFFIHNTVDFTDPVVDNEEILGLEAGYRFTTSNFTANLNGYYTSWANRFLLFGGTYNNGADEGAYLLTGITQLHKGLELDFQTHLTPSWM